MKGKWDSPVSQRPSPLHSNSKELNIFLWPKKKCCKGMFPSTYIFLFQQIEFKYSSPLPTQKRLEISIKKPTLLTVGWYYKRNWFGGWNWGEDNMADRWLRVGCSMCGSWNDEMTMCELPVELVNRRIASKESSIRLGFFFSFFFHKNSTLSLFCYEQQYYKGCMGCYAKEIL